MKKLWYEEVEMLNFGVLKLHCMEATCMQKSEVEMTSGVVTLR